ncbi:MAG TPA: zf-HC2 domain-containing protein [Actinomycetota bacterium]
MTEMNECDVILQEIQLYIDGEVTSERAAKLEEHLSTCTPCMHRAEFQVKLKEIVRSKCRLQAPDHLVVRIRRIIRSGG